MFSYLFEKKGLFNLKQVRRDFLKVFVISNYILLDFFKSWFH